MLQRIVLCLLLACAGLFAESGQPATYVVGNISDLAPGDTGMFRLLGNEFVFKTAKTAIPVPYRLVTELEMGPVASHPSDEPIWKLHKRLAPKTQYRTLTINFKGEGEEVQTFTIELPENAATEAQETIEIRSGLRRGEAPPSVWWGDYMWRTTRNKQDWEGEKK
jgi:hypothetical protein